MGNIYLSDESMELLVTAYEEKIRRLEGTVEEMSNSAREWYRREQEWRMIERDLRGQIRELENRINPPVAPEDFDWTTVEGMDKIPAIKAYRDATRLGLKDSKDAVEQAAAAGKFQFRTYFQSITDPIID